MIILHTNDYDGLWMSCRPNGGPWCNLKFLINPSLSGHTNIVNIVNKYKPHVCIFDMVGTVVTDARIKSEIYSINHDFDMKQKIIISMYPEILDWSHSTAKISDPWRSVSIEEFMNLCK